MKEVYLQTHQSSNETLRVQVSWLFVYNPGRQNGIALRALCLHGEHAYM